MNRKFAALVMVLLLALTAFAQQPIRGFVVDGTSGEPLPVANVTVSGTTRGSATNLDGFFLIPAMQPGTYTLTVSYIGYQTREVEVEVTHETMEVFRIELYPASVELEEVIYTVEEEDDQAKRESPRVSTVPVDQQTIRMIPSLGAEMDVLRAVQAIPGVKATSEISSAPIVRGGSSDMTLIMMDQSTVYNPSHMFGIFSTFNGDAVKRLELMKGGFPAEYGGRAGSVLEVVTNDGNRRDTKGLASIGIVSARAALEGPINSHGSYAISGRRTYMEPVIKAMEESMDTDLPSYFFYDANGKINFDISKNTTVTVGGYVGLDDLDFEFGSDDARAALTTFWGNKTSTGRLRQVLTTNSFLTAGFAWSQFNSGAEFIDVDEETGDDIVIQSFENRFDDINARVDWEYLGLPGHKIKVGVNYNALSTKVLNKAEETTYIDIDTTASIYAGYVQDQWKINERFEILPGYRYTWHKDADLQMHDPRFAIVYNYSPEVRFKFSTGRYHQNVNLMSAGGALSVFDIWVPQDGSIKPTYADQFILGYEWDFRPGHELTFEGYYNKLSNVLEYDASIDEGETLADAFLVGEGHAWGFELLFRKDVGKITGWVGYSLSWSERRFPGTYVNNGDWYYPKWDRRHDFIFVGMYKINDHWDLSSQWRYNTGQGYTQAMGIYNMRFAGVPDSDLEANARTLLYGEKNNYRFPADHRLDISANYRHTFFGLPATATLSIYNVYSRRAVFTRSYDTNENPVEYEDVKLLPILPLLSYEVRF